MGYYDKSFDVTKLPGWNPALATGGGQFGQSTDIANAILNEYKQRPLTADNADYQRWASLTGYDDGNADTSLGTFQKLALADAMKSAGYRENTNAGSYNGRSDTDIKSSWDGLKRPYNMVGNWIGATGDAANPHGLDAGAGGEHMQGLTLALMGAGLGAGALGLGSTAPITGALSTAPLVGDAIGAGTLAGSGGVGSLVGGAAADTLGAGAGTLPTWAGGAAEGLGGGVGGTGLGGASLAGQGLTTAAGAGSTFGGAELAGSGFLSDLPAWAGGAGGTSLGGSGMSLSDLLKKSVNAPPGTTSALSKLLSGGDLTPQDIASLTTAGLGALTGIAGADASRSANNAAADKMLALGAPARAEYNRTISPGFDPSSMPGYTSAIDQVMQSYLRKASTGGNPFSNPGVSMEANKYVTDSTALPAINNYRASLVSAGNTGVGNAAQPNVNAAGAVGGATNAVAGGLGALSAPNNGIDLSKLSDQLNNFFRWNNTGNAAV